MLQQCNWLF